jgi:hypothetical protein
MQNEKRARVEAGSIKLEGGLLVELFERHASYAGRVAYLLTAKASSSCLAPPDGQSG